MKIGAYEFSKVRKILQIGELFCEKVNPRCLKAQKSGEKMCQENVLKTTQKVAVRHSPIHYPIAQAK